MSRRVCSGLPRPSSCPCSLGSRTVPDGECGGHRRDGFPALWLLPHDRVHVQIVGSRASGGIRTGGGESPGAEWGQVCGWHGIPPSHLIQVSRRGDVQVVAAARGILPQPLHGRQKPPPLPHSRPSCDRALGFQTCQRPHLQPPKPPVHSCLASSLPQFPKLFFLSILAGERGRLRSRLSPALPPRAPRPRGTSHHRPPQHF